MQIQVASKINYALKERKKERRQERKRKEEREKERKKNVQVRNLLHYL